MKIIKKFILVVIVFCFIVSNSMVYGEVIYLPERKTGFEGAGKAFVDSYLRSRQLRLEEKRLEMQEKQYKEETPLPPKRHSQIYLGANSKHWISKKIDGGEFIKLEDGSLWKISLIDKINTMLWLPIEDVVVTESENPLYPYKLINTDSGNTADAELISK